MQTELVGGQAPMSHCQIKEDAMEGPSRHCLGFIFLPNPCEWPTQGSVFMHGNVFKQWKANGKIKNWWELYSAAGRPWQMPGAGKEMAVNVLKSLRQWRWEKIRGNLHHKGRAMTKNLKEK